MSETQSARAGSSRGRGGARGGRGGYRGRNTDRTKKDSNDQENTPPVALDDQGEVGELKRQYGDKVPLLREVCPGWSDEDLVFALQETNGDIEAAVDRISSGKLSHNCHGAHGLIYNRRRISMGRSEEEATESQRHDYYRPRWSNSRTRSWRLRGTRSRSRHGSRSSRWSRHIKSSIAGEWYETCEQKYRGRMG